MFLFGINDIATHQTTPHRILDGLLLLFGHLRATVRYGISEFGTRQIIQGGVAHTFIVKGIGTHALGGREPRDHQVFPCRHGVHFFVKKMGLVLPLLDSQCALCLWWFL